jgi:hypothetical protein
MMVVNVLSYIMRTVVPQSSLTSSSDSIRDIPNSSSERALLCCWLLSSMHPPGKSPQVGTSEGSPSKRGWRECSRGSRVVSMGYM